VVRGMLRIVSTTAILGYGFPKNSLAVACNSASKRIGAAAAGANQQQQQQIIRPALIAADAGSIDPGPYYLASGESFTDDRAVERDLKLMYDAAKEAGCPVVIGSCHGAGANKHLHRVFEISKKILPKSAKVALIPAEVPHDVVRRKFREGKIRPLGPLMDTDLSGKRSETDRALKYLDESVVVAQMGFNGIAKALAEGADVVLAGRTYDPACFAALPLLLNQKYGVKNPSHYDVGLCLHMGKILECGAIACDPGSGSDVLVCDLEPQQATFWCPNENRIATSRSVSAHTLYEKSEAHRFGLPGGLLLTHLSQFDENKENKSVKLTKSSYYPLGLQLKLEGAFMSGHRYISMMELPATHNSNDLVKLQDFLKPTYSSVVYYGINGVEGSPIQRAMSSDKKEDAAEELGIVVTVRSADKRHAKTICALLRSTMLHFGYVGRKSTAGNLAFPFSPSDCSFVDSAG
jgi:hypothetical protein